MAAVRLHRGFATFSSCRRKHAPRRLSDTFNYMSVRLQYLAIVLMIVYLPGPEQALKRILRNVLCFPTSRYATPPHSSTQLFGFL